MEPPKRDGARRSYHANTGLELSTPHPNNEGREKGWRLNLITNGQSCLFNGASIKKKKKTDLRGSKGFWGDEHVSR